MEGSRRNFLSSSLDSLYLLPYSGFILEVSFSPLVDNPIIGPAGRQGGLRGTAAPIIYQAVSGGKRSMENPTKTLEHQQDKTKFVATPRVQSEISKLYTAS